REGSSDWMPGFHGPYPAASVSPCSAGMVTSPRDERSVANEPGPKPFGPAAPWASSDRHDHRLVARKLRDLLDRKVEVGRYEFRGHMGEPVGQRHVLKAAASEHLEEHEVRIADIPDVMAEIALHVADVAGVEVRGHRARSG